MVGWMDEVNGFRFALFWQMACSGDFVAYTTLYFASVVVLYEGREHSIQVFDNIFLFFLLLRRSTLCRNSIVL